MLTQLIKNLIVAILISKCYCDKIILKRSMSCPIITDKMINSYKKIIIKHKYDNSSILQKDYSKILNKRVEKSIYLRNRERYNFK